MGAMYYFLITCAVGSAGALAGIAYLAGKDDKNETLEDIQGRGRKRPYVAVATTVCLASLAGMPPVAGFLAKFTLFTDALSGGLGVIAAIAFGLSLVAAVFYLRIAFVLFMPLKAECECQCCCGKNTVYAYLLRFAVTLAAIALIVVGIFPKVALIV
jgi:NADH-quinone oxidoreductase subunit N